ncbi:hypothetical protein G6F32_016720 [Rhizopus arrhizus]|nr:hypothetical protein G6F32_016720 [Rhizopus arrhizus]
MQKHGQRRGQCRRQRQGGRHAPDAALSAACPAGLQACMQRCGLSGGIVAQCAQLRQHGFHSPRRGVVARVLALPGIEACTQAIAVGRAGVVFGQAHQPLGRFARDVLGADGAHASTAS